MWRDSMEGAASKAWRGPALKDLRIPTCVDAISGAVIYFELVSHPELFI
jgi:hypothetical protein